MTKYIQQTDISKMGVFLPVVLFLSTLKQRLLKYINDIVTQSIVGNRLLIKTDFF